LSKFFEKAKKHPYNQQFEKMLKIFKSENIEPIDINNFDNTNATINPIVIGNKRNDLIALRNGLFDYSKDYYQWILDSKKMRADLKKVISEMEDLSNRVLNPGSHSSAVPLYKKEIKDAIKKLENHSKILGIIK
jgi:hypothetical protein